MDTTTNTNYLIIAHMQVPTTTLYNLEPKSMFIPRGLDISEFIEFICGDLYTVDDLKRLAMPDAKEERKEYGLSYDRIMFTLTVGMLIDKLSRSLPDVPKVVEYLLKEIGVTLERVPMLIDSDTTFTFLEDGVAVSETYDQFTAGWYTECIDCLMQDYSIVTSYLPCGDWGLLEMMNLFLWERGMWEMGEKFELPRFNIRFAGVSAGE